MQSVETALEVWRLILLACETFQLLRPRSDTTTLTGNEGPMTDNDIKRWLLNRDIAMPDQAASAEQRQAYIETLSAELAQNKDPQIRRLLVTELNKARRNLAQKRYRNSAGRRTMTPTFSAREIAILDWIALKSYNNTKHLLVLGGNQQDAIEENKDSSAEIINASRNNSLRFLIDEYSVLMSQELGTDFETTLKDLEKNQTEYQNTWRSRTSMMQSSNNMIRLKAPKPPGRS